jgi:hypothetical protein
MKVTYYNINGDPVQCKDNAADKKAMEAAGFSATNPKDPKPATGFRGRKARQSSDVESAESDES